MKQESDGIAKPENPNTFGKMIREHWEYHWQFLN